MEHDLFQSVSMRAEAFVRLKAVIDRTRLKRSLAYRAEAK